ncbi:hypothetical protein FRC12_014841 [Ceratobasidium sp. 428]|nr:hypothetical protein FRC12_014841 [Ceratobasidium sp. 428]
MTVVESPTAKSFPERTTSPRPRPSSLNLKALALAASTLPTPSATPSPTPVPRSLPGMKPLNLGNPARRQSMIALGGSSPRNSIPPSRRQSLRSELRGSGSTHSSRDSVINRLPPTPGTASPSSSTAGIEGFLQKNQEVLISRIEQLEKALAQSRRVSADSNASSGTTSTLAEEQITLIAELKSERNGLLEEIAGWRTRVEDLERQAALYAKRVESERREASIARERMHELEAERCAWETGRLAQEEMIARARDDAVAWRAKFEEVSKGECHWQAKAVNLESDVLRLEMELAAVRRQNGPATPTNKCWNTPSPMAPRRFDGSVSSASTTDVDEAASYTSGDMDSWKMKPRVPSPLLNMDVVVEEEEEDSSKEPSLDEDEESHCVEEDEDDVASDILDEVNGGLCVSDSMGSFTSPDANRADVPPANRSELSPNFKFPPVAPAPSHARTGSMIKGWQMPRGPVAVKSQSPPKPDRFFDQLEHLYSANDSENESPIPPSLPSPEFGTFKGDGGASAFTFGTKRNTAVGPMRGHGTRASRASISVGAFDGLGLPAFKNPKPEWIVKSESNESVSASAKSPIPASNTMAHLQGQGSSAGGSRAAPQASPRQSPSASDMRAYTGRTSYSPSSSDADPTPKMAKPPTFTPAPTTSFSTTSTKSSSPSSSSSPRTLVRRKPSLTRAQPTGRAPPRVPFDPYDQKSRSPFSVSYSRTSSRSSKSRLSIAEAEAIEAAIEQAQAVALAQQQSRLSLAGLTSLIPWGMRSNGVPKVAAPVCEVEERVVVQKPVVRKESGSVSREAQLARLRREMQSGKVLSGPCCSRCKSDVIQL